MSNQNIFCYSKPSEAKTPGLGYHPDPFTTTTTMNTTFFISRSAVARLFDVTIGQVKRVVEYVNAVWVWIQGRRPTFVSKKRFVADFVNFRRQGAVDLRVSAFAGGGDFDRQIQTRSPNGNHHTVVLHGANVTCDCADYRHQVDHLGIGCCKHAYKALGFLGFGSLRDYQAAYDRHRVEETRHQLETRWANGVEQVMTLSGHLVSIE